MPVQVKCPSCGQSLLVRDEGDATRLKCLVCGHVFAPTPEAPPEEPTPVPQHGSPVAPDEKPQSRSWLMPALVGLCVVLVIGVVVAAFLLLGGDSKYDKVKPPSEPTVFRWDFSKPDVVHTYDYEQEMTMHTDMDMGASDDEDAGDMAQEISAKGLLLVKSHGDGTADLVLQDMKMRMSMDIGEDEGARTGDQSLDKEPETMEQTMPPMVIQGMKEDGSGSFGNNSQEMLLKMLFPLPSKTIKVGESVDIPAQMPFNAMGSLLQVKGRSRITLKRYVRIGARTCAQLDVDIDISDLEVPSELKGEYECSTKGSSEYYFDVASRSFVSGTTALIMQFSVDAPMPKMNMPGEAASDMPERSKTSMAADTLLRVTLRE